MATCTMEQPQAIPIPKKSIWRRLGGNRKPSAKLAAKELQPADVRPPPKLERKDSVLHQTPPTTTTTDASLSKIQRRRTQVYRETPYDQVVVRSSPPPQKATVQSPPSPQEAKPASRPATRPPSIQRAKEVITIMNVQRIDIPATRRKPRVISLTRVEQSDMRIIPFPASPSVRAVAWNVFLAPEQVYSLVMGFKPHQEDKWFVYAEGPDCSGKLKVHFHRSWTGIKIAELFIVVDLKGEGAGTIVGIKWNGTEQTEEMSEDEAKYMVSTTCSWVLGVHIERDALPAMRLER